MTESQSASSLRTFDVFETALIRRVGVPRGVFALLGADPEIRRTTGLAPAIFAALREWCERDQRRTDPTGEIALEQIWRALVRDLRLDDELVPRLAEVELALEGALLTGNPLMREHVADARQRHGRVVWLSDTYVPSAWLMEQLERHGFWAAGDRLYVSSEHHACKNRGDLYALVAREVGLPPGRLEHVGNDPHVDGERARQAGWRAVAAPEANPNRYELALEACSESSEGLSSLLAGASVLTRLHGKAAGEGSGLWNIAASAAGPSLSAFVLWLLVRAGELGLERLYFVARDGELLLRMARRLQPLVPSAEGVELRYLYGSRQAWHLPAADLNFDRVRGWLCERADRASVRDILARLRMDPSEIAPLLPVDGVDSPLGDDGEHFVDELLSRPEFQSRVCAAAEEARNVLLGYLEQEGLLDAGPYACVELGWHGRALHSLDLVLSSTGHGAARYQFFGLYPVAGPDGAPPRSEAFFRDFRDGGPDVSWAHLYFLEAFCAGLEGRTKYIERKDGRYEPVLAHPRNEAKLAWGLQEIYDGVDRFVEELCAGLEAAPAPASKPNLLALRPAIDVILETLWDKPRPDEACVLGAIPLRENLLDDSWQTLAHPFGWRDAAAALTPAGHSTALGWYAGSAALSGGGIRRITGLAWRARALLSRLRGRLRRARTDA